MKKRLLSWLLVLSMVISLIPSTLVTPALAAYTMPSSFAGEYDVSNLDSAVFANGMAYKLTGSGTSPVVIPAGNKVTIVLDNVTINSAASPIQVGVGATLRLVPKAGTTNTLTCTSDTAEAVTTNNASGLTAGISVPKNATLIIDNDSAGDGTLTVNGGYGGAGIGGSYTGTISTTQFGANGNDGTPGATGKTAGHAGANGGAPGQLGTGGLGGAYGEAGSDAGVIQINGSILTAQGGTGGAGIGGGRGTDGAAGALGTDGTQGSAGGFAKLSSQADSYGGSGSGGGGGAGGSGGNGGTGGAGAEVTIAGGEITVIGGADGAAGIGGGAGGNGGAGGSGGNGGAMIDARCQKFSNWSDYWSNVGGGGAGGNGAGGTGGRGGAGGAANTLTIQGGKVTVRGTYGFGGGSVGSDGQNGNGTRTDGEAGRSRPVSGFGSNFDSYWRNGGTGIQSQNANYIEYHAYNSIHAVMYVGKPVSGGNGGTAAAQAPANSDGAAGTLNIVGSSNNVDFKNTSGSTSVNNRPVDKNGDLLYKTVITVKNLENTETLANATISIPVTKGSSTYYYETVTDSMGHGIVWLPEGSYVLKGKMVQSPADGYMTEDKTLAVDANDSNAITVNVGIALTLKTSTANKAYFSDDSENALDIIVDGSKITGSIQKIRWFREAIIDNDQMYGTGSIAFAPFNEGYGDAGDTDRGELTPTGLVQKIPVNQNGRYWFEIEVVLTGDGGTATTVTLTKLLTVNNIYREFTIQTRTREMTRESGVKYTSDYSALKNADGTDYQASYGFPWDLHGYDAGNISNGTLLTGVDYDQVPINALRTKASWYSATFGGQGTHISKNAAGNAYETINLTLDQTFLTPSTNKDADKVGSVTDIRKYTITYIPEGVPVAQFPVRFVELNEDGSEKQEFYSYDAIYPDSVPNATVYALAQDGYRLKTVLVNGVERKADLKNGGIELKNIQGTPAANYADAITKVEFVYENNMTNVTIHGYLKGTTTTVFDDITVSVEKGTKFTYPAPVVSGYDNADDDLNVGTIESVAEGAEITFQYLHSKGNVTYQAVDANGRTPLATKTVEVRNGETINVTEAKAAELFTIPYYTLTGVGNVENATADGKYNGKDDVTVTYTYTRNKHSLTVKKVDIDTGSEIPGSAQTISDLPAGKQYIFKTTVITPDNYTPVGVNPTAYLVEDRDGEVTFHYRKAGVHRYAEVTVECFYTENEQETVFHSYKFPAFKDMETTITAPTLTGYTPKDGVKNSKTITPKGVADDDKVRFEYVLDDPRSITVKLINHEGTELPAPKGYTTKYTIKKGDSVQISAPAIDGYTLKTGQSSVVTVDYTKQLPGGGDIVTFTYQPVSQANFVTHTVKFMLNNIPIYEYDKLILKAADTTEYTETSVTLTIPGYS